MLPLMQEEVDYNLKLLKEAVEAKEKFTLLKVTELLHSADLAQFQETLVEREEMEFFVTALGAKRYAHVLAELPEELVEVSFSYLSAPEQRELFSYLHDNDQTDILRALCPKKRREILNILEKKDKELVGSLLNYEEDTAGGWMTTQFGRVSIEMTIKQALESLKHDQESNETLSRIYVVDEREHLQGRIRFRDLAFNTWETPIREILKPVEHTILATADQEEVAMTVKKYDLVLAPVVDEENRLLGVITHDDAMEIAEQESTEDMERIAGLTGEHTESAYLYTTVFTHFRRRFLWLFGLAILAVASGYIMLKFESVLSSVYMLSLFLPMVIAAGGNTGGQAATMVIRSMALGELNPSHVKQVAWKELRLGALIGIILALVIFIVCVTLLPLFRAPLPPSISYTDFGSAVAVALYFQVMFSTLIGALLPLGARALKLDPAVIAAPAITTVVDVIGMAIYFTSAQAVLAI